MKLLEGMKLFWQLDERAVPTFYNHALLEMAVPSIGM